MQGRCRRGSRIGGRASSRAMKAMSFVLGLSVSTGVIYVFTAGNTPVYIGYCVAAIAFVMLLLACPLILADAATAVDNSVLAFCGLAALSLVPSLVYATIGGQGIDVSLTVLKGLVVLVAGVIVYIVAISLRSSRDMMVTGVAFGVALNVAFSVAANIAFNAGSVLSLYSLFPQDAFIVPLRWGVLEPAGSHAIYTFRAQGLFLEASHLMVFLVTWGLLCTIKLKHMLIKTALLVGVVYVSAQALSPNVAVLMLEAVLVLVVRGVPKNRGSFSVQNKNIPHATIVAFFALLFATFLSVLLFGDAISVLVGNIVDSLGDLDVASSTDTGTAARFDSMLTTLSILPSYPFGAGWNTESIVLATTFGESAFASHSFALRLLLEVGPLGLLAYCWVVWRHASRAYRASRQGRFVAVSLVCMAIAQFLNGITLLPYVWLLLGIAKGIEMEHVDAEKSRMEPRLRGRAMLSEERCQ